MLNDLVMISAIVICIVGNGYVIASVLSNKKLKNWIGIHILSMAVLNIFIAVLLKTSFYLVLFHGSNLHRTDFCALLSVFFLSAPTVTSLLLISSVFCLIIAAWRRKMSLTTISIKTSMILVVSMAILGIGCGYIVFDNYNKLGADRCEINYEMYKMFGLVNLIPAALLIILVMILAILRKLRQPLREPRRDEQPSAVYRNLSVEVFNEHEDEDDEVNDSRLYRTLIAMSSLFVLCWLSPRLLWKTKDTLSLEILAASKPVFEPILLIIVNPEFRVLLRKAKFW